MKHAADRRMQRQILRHLQRVRRMLSETHRQGTHATQSQISIVGTHAQAQCLMGLCNPLRQLRILDRNRALHQVGMTRQVFRDRLDREVRAQRQRLVEQARAPGVVDRQQHAVPASEGRKLRQVEHFIQE